MGDLPLDLSHEQRGELGREVMEFLERWLERRSAAPASWPPPDDATIESLLQPPAEQGRDLGSMLDAVDRATDTGFDTAGEGFLSFIPSGGLHTASLGTLIGAVTNQYTGAAHSSPGMTALEESVVRWMTGLFGLPDTAAGVLVSGGSIANLIAVVTARSRFGEDFADGMIYTSRRVHHSVEKAARIAGITGSAVRLVETDHRRRLDPDALRRHIETDLASGRRPMMIVATAGTTDTGAIDPLHACADIAAETGAWFHADGAYGGFFQLTDRGRDRLAGIDRANSITIDGHKSLFLPFGIGGLLMRDPSPVVDAHEGAGAYMQDISAGSLPHYMELGPELTRPNRGLPVWLALNLHGIGAFRAELDRMLDLAERTAGALDAIDGIELLGRPDLSIVAFRATAGDAATRAILDALLSSREVHVSSTTVDDTLFVRFAFLSQRTTDAVADRAVELVRQALAAR